METEFKNREAACAESRMTMLQNIAARRAAPENKALTLEQLREMKELKPCPSQWDAAVNYLNAYRNSHYADTMTEDSYWLADAINTILPFAVNAYRRAAPENKALTLEQLRRMDGEPVWAAGKRSLGTDVNGWMLITTKSSRPAALDCTGACNFADYGKTWLAYARHPEDAK